MDSKRSQEYSKQASSNFVLVPEGCPSAESNSAFDAERLIWLRGNPTVLTELLLQTGWHTATRTSDSFRMNLFATVSTVHLRLFSLLT